MTCWRTAARGPRPPGRAPLRPLKAKARPPQILHFAALILVAVAIAIIMTPAAYHRLVERGFVSDFFVRLASWLVAAAMLPLMLALCIEVYLLGRVILHQQWICALVAVFLLTVFSGLWFFFPFAMRGRRPDT